MDRVTIATIFGALSAVMFALYMYKSRLAYTRPDLIGKEVIYIIKSITWLVVSLGFLLFSKIPTSDAHILIFVSWGAVLLVELGYNIIYLRSAARDIKKWIQKR